MVSRCGLTSARRLKQMLSHSEESQMSKSAWMSAAAIALLTAAAILLPDPSSRATAQSAPTYVNAVDLDIVPEHREQFLAAIKENGAATVKEPGCRQFDILVLASNPNHVFLYEVYDNEAALQSHRNTDHFKKYAATTANMVAAGNVAGGAEHQGPLTGGAVVCRGPAFRVAAGIDALPSPQSARPATRRHHRCA
jgi:quinol monooxygenase YgiN